MTYLEYLSAWASEQTLRGRNVDFFMWDDVGEYSDNNMQRVGATVLLHMGE